MAAAKKKAGGKVAKAPAKKVAKKAVKKVAVKKAAKKRPDIARPVASDPTYPDIHPSRHAKSGMQEPNTAGMSQTAEERTGESPVGSLSPMIGATAPELRPQPGSLPMDAEKLSAQDYVWSQDQAIALPVVDKGTPVAMPSEAKLKTLRAKMAKEQGEASIGDSDDPETDKRVRERAVKFMEERLANRVPVVSFKNKDRITMLVVKTKDGLAAMPAPAYKELAKAVA